MTPPPSAAPPGHDEWLLSWGRRPTPASRVLDLIDPVQATTALRDTAAAGLSGLAVGLGRSYGDVGLNPGGVLWRTTGLDHFMAFDEASGLLRCEAGVSLRDIQALALPRGWTLPVVPGTQFVTVGGAIANDVHGKNHHRQGSFGDHVRALRLRRTDGAVIDTGPAQREDWWRATIGGLGLTGLIIEATLQLQRVAGPWLLAQTLPFRGLDAFQELADGSEAGWEHTVAWIDCLSGARGRAWRGLFLRANVAPPDQQAEHQPGRQPERGRPAPPPTRRVPFTPPFSLVNRLTLAPFNAAYYHLQRLKGSALQRVRREPYFHPLDGVLDWNRLYGPRGFYQYQCVLPRAAAADALQALLARIAASGEGSFLAVLKTFGERPAPGLLSFARPGVTLALDFRDAGARTLALLDALDAIVAEAGGALYPAKDARMPRALFQAGFPRLAEFLPYRDPGIASALSRRLIDD